MKAFILITIYILCSFSTFSQEKSYTIFSQNGKQVKYKKMVKSLSKSGLVFFGEIHNNAIAHWLEIELTRDLDEKRDLILGAELFETDTQDIVNQYLDFQLDDEQLDTLARAWPNYKSDYAPLVTYARANGLEFIATNIPRKFANQVYKGGFESLDQLTEQELEWVAPLPIDFDPTLPQYQKIVTEMGDHGSPKLVKAQAIKDATMAHFNLESSKLFLHFNGSWHSNYHEGIVWYVRKQSPEINLQTIAIVTQSEIEKLNAEHMGVADFIICVDDDIPGTY